MEHDLSGGEYYFEGDERGKNMERKVGRNLLWVVRKDEICSRWWKKEREELAWGQ